MREGNDSQNTVGHQEQTVYEAFIVLVINHEHHLPMPKTYSELLKHKEMSVLG